MTLDMIRVWKFDEAPADLKRLHSGEQRPQWLVLIPASIYRLDMDAAIRAQSCGDELCEYQTKTGDIVYTGAWGQMFSRMLPTL
jgi:hypothetical protein